MLPEALLLLGLVAFLLVLLSSKNIAKFIRLYKFKRNLKGPKLSEVIANAKKESERD